MSGCANRRGRRLNANVDETAGSEFPLLAEATILLEILVVLRHGLMFRQPGCATHPESLRQRSPTVGQDQRGFGLAFHFLSIRSIVRCNG